MIRTYYDEMYDGAGQVRPHYREFARWLAETPAELLAQRRREADLLFHRAGSPSRFMATSRAPNASFLSTPSPAVSPPVSGELWSAAVSKGSRR